MTTKKANKPTKQEIATTIKVLKEYLTAEEIKAKYGKLFE